IQMDCNDKGKRTRVLEKYKNLSDQEIEKDCTYNLLAADPNASAEKIRTNERRTSRCTQGLLKMREIGKGYLEKRETYCSQIQNSPGCTDATNQAACITQAGKLSAGAHAAHSALRDLL